MSNSNLFGWLVYALVVFIFALALFGALFTPAVTVPLYRDRTDGGCAIVDGKGFVYSGRPWCGDVELGVPHCVKGNRIARLSEVDYCSAWGMWEVEEYE